MPPDPIFGEAERKANFAHLVFKERAQRLDQLEGHVLWQTAYVVVRLDARRGHGGIVAGAFNHVGIERSLREKVNGADQFQQPQRLLLEDANELRADDFTLL